MQKLILIGGGGHCKACIEVVQLTNQYEIVGILDRLDLVGTDVLGHKIIGVDSEILKYKELGCHFLITVGQIKSALSRKKIYALLMEYNSTLATVISPKANVSQYAKIEHGTIVMHGATVNAAAVVGPNCILNTGSNIEHDTIIGRHTHISTSAVVNGGCVIGDEVFIGSNATISSQIVLGSNIVIGSGAVVIKDISEVGIYVGNPAKKTDK